MQCEIHNNRHAHHTCDECGKPLCSSCAQQTPGLDEMRCPSCYNQVIEKKINAKRYHLNSHILRTLFILSTYLIGMAVFIFVPNDVTRWIGLIFIVIAGALTGYDLEYNARQNARAILMTESGQSQSVLFYYSLSILLGVIVIPLYVIYRFLKIPSIINTIRKDLPEKLINN